ncbi:MAG: ABC transporter permease subunit [Arthrobacter sp.]|uniref:ABC transporter permease subunit n=1 Tax=Arthrobacter sp. TaxID=1667 RepID=UPI00348CD07C
MSARARSHRATAADAPSSRPRLPLLRKALADSWRSTLGWSAGLAAVMLVYLPLYPAIGANAEVQGMLDALPQELVKALNYGEVASGPGYTQATFFGLFGYLLMSIAAIGWGASAVGGDEDDGLLELTLAHGTTRTRVVLERAAALVVRVAVLAAVTLSLLLVLREPAQLGVDPANALAAETMLVLLVLLPGTAALLAGSVGGRRVHGTAAGSVVAVLAYALNALGNQNPDLEWLHPFSPYHWAFGQSPLVNGIDAPAALGLAALSAALVALSAVALNRRDVGAH